MAYYDGEPVRHGPVELRSPTAPGFLEARAAADVELSDWYNRAADDDSITYFAAVIAADGSPVGEVLLHDIDRQQGRARIHLHLFQEQRRIQGLGEHGVRAAVEYAFRQAKLKELSLVVAEGNFPARRCCAKCGFEQIERLEDDRSQVVMCLSREQWRQLVEDGEW